jgi:hypothetical protein
MTHWEQPHWSGRPQVAPDTRPRLKPNGFARLARWSAHHAGLVIVMAMFLASLAAGLALFSIRLYPQAAPLISLDSQTAAAQARLDQQFPGIDATFYAMVEHKNPAYARSSAEALAAELRRHGKLFQTAFVPGTGEFYDRYGLYYLPTAEVDRRVTQALQTQPLFHALASAPTMEGLAALARSIANAVAQGTPPVALEDVLRPMADAVEAEIAGKPRPVDWVDIAGLKAHPVSPRWYIIAKPVAGQETAAAAAAQVIGSRIEGLNWAFPPHTFDGQPPRLLRDVAIPALLSAFMVVMLLAAGLGSFRQVAAVITAGGVALSVSAGIAAAAHADFDAVTWSLAAAVLAPSFLFATTIAIAFGTARANGKSVFTAIMLAAQRGGPLLVAFAGMALALWLAWLPRQIDSLGLLAIGVAAGIALAALLALTLVPAILAAGHPPGEEGHIHWLDEAVSLPVSLNLRNLRAVLALVLMAAAVFCAIFVPNVKFGDAQLSNLGRAALDTPNAIGAVHLVVPQEEALPAIERLGNLPEVGAVRWLNQFLPVDVAAKQNALRSLAGLVPPPAAAPGSAATADQLAALDEDLKIIANSAGDTGGLRDAAHRLRRALQLFAGGAMPEPARIAALEDALFGGLGRLSAEADRLAALTAPGADELEPGLLRHYLSPDGELRIEVLPKASMTSLSFAAAMRRQFPGVSGVPVVALARNEIMHHEAIYAYGPGLLVAFVLAALFARAPARIAVALVPTPMMLSLAAAALVSGGELVDAAALAAFATAIAMSLAASLTLATAGRRAGGEGDAALDGSFRAALLPLAVALSMVVPMMVSGSPAIASFAYVSSLLLALAIVTTALVGPQIAAWLAEERSEASGE